MFFSCRIESMLFIIVIQTTASCSLLLLFNKLKCNNSYYLRIYCEKGLLIENGTGRRGPEAGVQ